MSRKLRMGMVGGGQGAFIGDVHRKAARLTGEIDLVAGVFGRNHDKSLETAKALYLDPARVYSSFEEMARAEAALPADKRIDFVTVATPNITHFPISKLFLENGFHVLCEKPVTISSEQAIELSAIIAKNNSLFALMHNYTGFPMVKQARQMVKDGVLGDIRKINVEYSLGWLASPNASKQAIWRVDPERAGISGCMADIGTHAQNLIHYITDLNITELSADLATFVPGRKLDDDGSVLLHFDNGAHGIIFASEVSTGEENNFIIKIYGEKAALEWHEQSPEDLIIRTNDAPMQVYRRNWGGCHPIVAQTSNLPAGHPEGFLEAFTNIYIEFVRAIQAKIDGKDYGKPDFPGIEDGISEMIFLEKMVQNANGTEKWTRM